MSWNGNDNNKDPWGRKDGPPDIDEAIDQFKKKEKELEVDSDFLEPYRILK